MDRFCCGNENTPDEKLLLGDCAGCFEITLLDAGWLEINGAGLLACENNTHPVRKVITEANVIHRRKLFLTIFMFNTFLYPEWLSGRLI